MGVRDRWFQNTFETIELFIKELYRLKSNLEFVIKNASCGVLAMRIIFPVKVKKRAYFFKNNFQ